MIVCHYCKIQTKSLEPIVLRRVTNNISISCICEKCLRTKSRFIRFVERSNLPSPIINNLGMGKTYINCVFEGKKCYNFLDHLDPIINDLARETFPFPEKK